MEKNKFAVVLDFDSTCTPKEVVSLYYFVDQRIPELTEKSEATRQKYLEKALAGRLTRQEEKNWFLKTIDIYAGTDMFSIKAILKKVPLREGLKETLKFLSEKDIPVAIISYGIMDFIKTVLKNHGCFKYVDQIYAAWLRIDHIGKITGHIKETEIYPYNKGVISLKFADLHGIPHENILAVGDSGGDANLGYLKTNRLGIASNREEAERLKEIMGEVVITETFFPVLEWIKIKIN